MNQATKNEGAGKKRNRLLAFAAAAMFAVAFGVFGGLFYLQGQAARGDDLAERAVQRHAAMAQAATMTSEQKAQVLARAKVLRDKWRLWAQKNQDALQAMLAASPQDKVALTQAWNTLPIAPPQAGISQQELSPTGNASSPTTFGWAPLEKAFLNNRGSSTADPSAQAEQERWKQQDEVARGDDFVALRDIKLSAGGTDTQIALWASGRVTEQSVLRSQEERTEIKKKLQALGRQGTPSDYLTPYHEVLPPYDFLTQSGQKGEQR